MNEDSSANMAIPKGKATKDGQEKNATKEKKRTRTLVKNIRNRDDRKANVLPKFAYVPVQKKPKKKAKCIYVVSDSENPSIVISQLEQNLEPIFERENEKQIVEEEEEEEERPIAETEKHKPVVKLKRRSQWLKLKRRRRSQLLTKQRRNQKW